MLNEWYEPLFDDNQWINPSRLTFSQGLYEQQDPNQRDFNLRGKFYTNDQGQYALYGIRPIPYPVSDTVTRIWLAFSFVIIPLSDLLRCSRYPPTDLLASSSSFSTDIHTDPLTFITWYVSAAAY
jgi:hypothetical protein